ncbi:MAG: DUF1622 domain-containing protein, partial [Candidatus Baltobacteraceae bacterium]
DAIAIWSTNIAVLINGAATLIITLATLEAVVRSIRTYVWAPPGSRSQNLQPTRWRLGHWLALALEFLIASDIIRTAVRPTWVDIGQLGAIVALRMIISYTLTRDVEEASPQGA